MHWLVVKSAHFFIVQKFSIFSSPYGEKRPNLTQSKEILQPNYPFKIEEKKVNKLLVKYKKL